MFVFCGEEKRRRRRNLQILFHESPIACFYLQQKEKRIRKKEIQYGGLLAASFYATCKTNRKTGKKVEERRGRGKRILSRDSSVDYQMTRPTSSDENQATLTTPMTNKDSSIALTRPGVWPRGLVHWLLQSVGLSTLSNLFSKNQLTQRKENVKQLHSHSQGHWAINSQLKKLYLEEERKVRKPTCVALRE